MANLEPLIRVRRHGVEQKQKALAELYRQLEELEGRKARQLQQLQEERAALGDLAPAESVVAFSAFATGVRQRVAALDGGIAKLETRIEAAREDMREAFAELKKIEITHARREDAELKALERKQAELLDEAAIEGFRRRAGVMDRGSED